MKIARSIGILYKVKNILPEYILKTLYNSLLLPHLTYGILAWGNNIPLFLINFKRRPSEL